MPACGGMALARLAQACRLTRRIYNAQTANSRTMLKTRHPRSRGCRWRTRRSASRAVAARTTCLARVHTAAGAQWAQMD